MKIANSDVTLTSQFQSEELTVQERSGMQSPGNPDMATEGSQDDPTQVEARWIWDDPLPETDTAQIDGERTVWRLKVLLEEFLMRELDGKNHRESESKELNPAAEGLLDLSNDPLWEAGARHEYTPGQFTHEYYHEQQQLDVLAEGTVTTEDGRTVDFSLYSHLFKDLELQRDIYTMPRTARKRKDPLVINFNGPVSQLTEEKYSFDLDSDGTEELISFVPSGSGFVFLDKNGDGIATNGQELFGPESGNGFADLAQYDQDGNGWIDENEVIFDKLKIWAKNPAGIDQIFDLQEAGVGAVYVGSVDTEFDLKDSQNELQGETRRFGLYLNEDGSAGSLEQIDLMV